MNSNFQSISFEPLLNIFTGLQLPNKIEMFYDPTGKETKIQPMGDDYGAVVYNNDIKCDANYFARALLEEKYKTKFKVEKNPIPKKIEPDSLLFESRFECGNLAKAIRITDTYYELRNENVSKTFSMIHLGYDKEDQKSI